jgi:hypothetical protein
VARAALVEQGDEGEKGRDLVVLHGDAEVAADGVARISAAILLEMPEQGRVVRRGAQAEIEERLVARAGPRRDDARAGVRRAARVGPVDEQRLQSLSRAEIRHRCPDDSAAHHDHVVHGGEYAPLRGAPPSRDSLV